MGGRQRLAFRQSLTGQLRFAGDAVSEPRALMPAMADAYINDVFRAADTIVLSRVMYEAIVPWWEIVAAGQVPDDGPEVSATFREFADVLAGMRRW